MRRGVGRWALDVARRSAKSSMPGVAESISCYIVRFCLSVLSAMDMKKAPRPFCRPRGFRVSDCRSCCFRQRIAPLAMWERASTYQRLLTMEPQLVFEYQTPCW